MEFEILKTDILGCLILKRKTFQDSRGEFFKAFEVNDLKKQGIEFSIAEIFYSNSKKSVVRGLHFQSPPHDHAKLVSCLSGHILDVIVDLRVGSPSFKKTIGVDLKALDGNTILVPRGCAHGFYTYTDDSMVAYIVETTREPSHEGGILWNSIDFKWPEETPIISSRDSELPRLEDYKNIF